MTLIYYFKSVKHFLNNGKITIVFSLFCYIYDLIGGFGAMEDRFDLIKPPSRIANINMLVRLVP
jgi:hypothetical protein